MVDKDAGAISNHRRCFIKSIKCYTPDALSVLHVWLNAKDIAGGTDS